MGTDRALAAQVEKAMHDAAKDEAAKGKHGWLYRFGVALGVVGGHAEKTRAELAELRERVAALEDNRLQYVGVHQEGREYRAGEIVTRSGSLWLAERDTDSTPGHGATAWKLVAKRGHFGP